MNTPPPGSPNSFRSMRPAPERGHHRRNSSHSSVASNLSSASMPTLTMQALMQTIAQAPKGSKMAEDAAKALLLAERARSKATGVPLDLQHRSPKPAPASPIVAPIPLRPPSRASHRSRSDSNSSIGRTMLSPAPLASSLAEEEDPFDLEDFSLDDGGGSVTDRYMTFTEILGAPYDMHSWVNPPPTPAPLMPLPPTPSFVPSGPRHPALSTQGRDHVLYDATIDRDITPVPAITQDLLRTRSQYLRPRKNAFTGVSGEQNAIGIFWRGDRPQQFSLITENVGIQQTDDVFPIHVAAQNTQVVEIPRQWSGFVQKLSGTPGDPATRCEITFDGYAGMTFFGVTYAYGHNGGVVIRSSPSDVQAGSPFRAAQVAPDSLCTINATGQRVLLGTVNVQPYLQNNLHKFYRDFFETAEQGGIMYDDQANIVSTRNRHLLLDFY